MRAVGELDVDKLIDPLWHGQREVTMRTKEWQRVLLYYGASFLFMHRGLGCHLAGRRVGPGIYAIRFVEAKKDG